MIDFGRTVLSCCEAWVVTVGPHDLLYVPAGMCFAEKVAVASGDVFGLRVRLVACSYDTNLSVIKQLRDSFGMKDATSEMANRYAAVFQVANDQIRERREQAGVAEADGAGKDKKAVVAEADGAGKDEKAVVAEADKALP